MVGQVVLQYLCSGGEKLQERKAIDIRYSVCVFPTRAGEAFQKKFSLVRPRQYFPPRLRQQQRMQISQLICIFCLFSALGFPIQALFTTFAHSLSYTCRVFVFRFLEHCKCKQELGSFLDLPGMFLF